MSALQSVRELEAIEDYLLGLRRVLERVDTTAIAQVLDVLLAAYRKDASVFILGNGGSASTASHFACDLGKGVQPVGGRRFRTLALTDNLSVITAWANDTAYDQVFAEQLDNLVREQDVVIAISASGKSPNVLRALRLARARGAVTVGLTGFEGGDLPALCNACVVVPSDRMDQIEDVHLALQHLICSALRGTLAQPVEVGV